MKFRILGIVAISVASIVLGLLAPAATTPPNPGYIHRVDFDGKTFWTDDEGATSTGAVPEDAARGFVPGSQGYSFGPETKTDSACAQPPAQSARDHATFSPSELALYGLPPRINGQSQAEWETIVRHAQTRSCTLETTYLEGRPVRNGISARHTMTPSRPSEAKFLNVWNEVYAQSPSAFTGWGIDESTYPEIDVDAYWHFPTINRCFIICDQQMSAWVGLGNDGVNPTCQGKTSMVQAGTGDLTQNGGLTYYTFVQNLGSSPNCNENRITNMTFANGDLMYVSVGQNATAFVDDQTKSSYYSGPVPLTGTATFADTGSSICTIEQNGGTQTMHQLPTFNSPVDFQFCRTEATVNGVSQLYPLPHVPGVLFLFRHSQVNTSGTPVYPDNYCAFAGVPTNGNDLTWPDTTFNVSFIQNC